MTVGAEVFLQELFDALHPLFVLDLREGVFHRVDGVVIGEVELHRALGVFRTVEDALFEGGAMVDDLFFLGG